MSSTYTVTRECPTCKRSMSWQKPRNRGSVHHFVMAMMAKHWQSGDCDGKAKLTALEKRVEAIVDTLVDAMVNDGLDVLSVREIAERIGVTPPQVNSAISSMFTTERGWRRITPAAAYVDVRERNYNTVTHQRRCQGYIVSREHLASIIRQLREQS